MEQVTSPAKSDLGIVQWVIPVEIATEAKECFSDVNYRHSLLPRPSTSVAEWDTDILSDQNAAKLRSVETHLIRTRLLDPKIARK